MKDDSCYPNASKLIAAGEELDEGNLGCDNKSYSHLNMIQDIPRWGVKGDSRTWLIFELGGTWLSIELEQNPKKIPKAHFDLSPLLKIGELLGNLKRFQKAIYQSEFWGHLQS